MTCSAARLTNGGHGWGPRVQVPTLHLEHPDSPHHRSYIMSTAFQTGDRVRSTTDAQGLRQGAPYSVVSADVRSTPFGDFVTYVLTDGTERYSVTNGHLLLYRCT